MKLRLFVQKNGYIVVETKAIGVTRTEAARDLEYRLEWFSNRGWVQLGPNVRGQFAALDAIKNQRLRNPTIKWRLVAFNSVGSVPVPSRWEGARA